MSLWLLLVGNSFHPFVHHIFARHQQNQDNDRTDDDGTHRLLRDLISVWQLNWRIQVNLVVWKMINMLWHTKVHRETTVAAVLRLQDVLAFLLQQEDKIPFSARLWVISIEIPLDSTHQQMCILVMNQSHYSLRLRFAPGMDDLSLRLILPVKLKQLQTLQICCFCERGADP